MDWHDDREYIGPGLSIPQWAQIEPARFVHRQSGASRTALMHFDWRL
jgi:hypothetical protein